MSDLMLKHANSWKNKVIRWNFAKREYMSDRIMSIPKFRKMASIGFKRFILSSKDMMSGDYESAILHLNKVPRKLFELSSHVAFNKSFCFEKLGDMSRALDESLKSLYIYPNDSRYYVKTGMLCQQLCRFFEAEFCLQNGLRCLTPGDIISAIKLRSLLKQNIYFTIKRSDCGLDETIIMAACLCCRNLK